MFVFVGHSFRNKNTQRNSEKKDIVIFKATIRMHHSMLYKKKYMTYLKLFPHQLYIHHPQKKRNEK